MPSPFSVRVLGCRRPRPRRGDLGNWLLGAALGSYAIAYRFYARFITRRVLEVDDTRATPAERLDNGVDYEPTDRRVLFCQRLAR